MNLYRELWRLLDRTDRLWLLVSPLLAVVIGLSSLVGIAAVIPFFAVLGDPTLISKSVWLSWAYTHLGFSSERSFLVALGVGFVATLLVSNAASMLGFHAITRFSYRLGEQFRAALLSEYLHRDLLFHARSHGAQLVNNTVYAVERVAGGVVRSALHLASSLVTVAMILTAAVAFNPRIALAAIVGLGGSYGLAYALVQRRIAANGLTSTVQTAQRLRIVIESLGGIRDILLSGSQPAALRRFAAASGAVARATAETLTIALAPRHVIECVTGTGLVAIALWLTARDGRSGSWLAAVSFLGLAAYRLLPELQTIFTSLVKIRADRAAFDRIHADLALGCERLRRQELAPEPGEFRGAPHRELRLERVCFGYEAGRARAVRDVSLSLPARRMIGVFGANGSGKTTLADLALGLLVPDAGVISVDGVRIEERNRAAWRAATAYVPQALFLAETTIAENIANGAALEAIDWQRLREAAAMACLEELVASLPEGFHSRVGERGVRLSGGQRQRIGIARALYRDASFLVLDEATSALDGLAEHEVLGAVQALRHHATILMIAHRVASLARCDWIVEMESGTVVNQGSFQELLAGSDRLRRIAELEPAGGRR